jgi:hypothetical protein
MNNLLMNPEINYILNEIYKQDVEGGEVFKNMWKGKIFTSLKIIIILDFQHIPDSLNKLVNNPSTLLLFTSFNNLYAYKNLWRSFIIMSILFLLKHHINLVFIFVDNYALNIVNENIIKKDKNFLMLEIKSLIEIHELKKEINNHLGMHEIDF